MKKWILERNAHLKSCRTCLNLLDAIHNVEEDPLRPVE